MRGGVGGVGTSVSIGSSSECEEDREDWLRGGVGGVGTSVSIESTSGSGS